MAEPRFCIVCGTGSHRSDWKDVPDPHCDHHSKEEVEAAMAKGGKHYKTTVPLAPPGGAQPAPAPATPHTDPATPVTVPSDPTGDPGTSSDPTPASKPEAKHSSKKW